MVLNPGGYSTNVYTKRLRPEVQPLTLLYTIFHEKSTAFVYLLSWQMVPLSHTLFRTLQPFNCCKCTVFGIGMLAPFGSFHSPKWQISLPFYIIQRVKSLPFHIPEAWKRYPFRAEPPSIGHHREYPSPPGVLDKFALKHFSCKIFSPVDPR